MIIIPSKSSKASDPAQSLVIELKCSSGHYKPRSVGTYRFMTITADNCSWTTTGHRRFSRKEYFSIACQLWNKTWRYIKLHEAAQWTHLWVEGLGRNLDCNSQFHHYQYLFHYSDKPHYPLDSRTDICIQRITDVFTDTNVLPLVSIYLSILARHRNWFKYANQWRCRQCFGN